MTLAGFLYWTFLAGLGLFLFAMSELEAALTDLVGGPLRRLLRRGTRTPLHGILFGILVTAALQSSSVVILMVLALVGAGVLAPVQALGVVLGANLGTTVTGWILAAVGFSLNLESLSLPLVGAGALAVVFLRSGSRARDAGRALFAFGLLLLGPSYMKSSIDSVERALDVSSLAGYPLILYGLVGVLFAAIIHSSSAVVMIALSALASGLIALPAAAALVLGADLGTTSTALLGAVGGVPGKKRVALAHFLVNATTVLVVFPLIEPLLALVRGVGFRDPIYALVAFHSGFNAIGILFFVPFLGPLSRFLESRFLEAPRGVAQFLPNVPPTVAQPALEAVELETAHLLARVMRHNLSAFRMEAALTPPVAIPAVAGARLATRSAPDEYTTLKLLEGEILNYAIQLQRQALREETATRLASQIGAARHALQSAKSIKDVRHNLLAYLRNEDLPGEDAREMGRAMAVLYGDLADLWHESQESVRLERLTGLIGSNRSQYQARLGSVHRQLAQDRLDPRDVSTALNINREVYGSTKSLIEAVGDHLLQASAARQLEAAAAVTAGGSAHP